MQWYSFLQQTFLIKSHQHTSKHHKALGSRSELLILHTLQKVLRSINTDFVEKVTKAFFSAAISLYKINNNHIKAYFLTLVTIFHLKLLVAKQLCNCMKNSYSTEQLQLFFVIDRNSFCLLLCDSAKYMVAAGAILQSLYPKVFCVACVT